MTLWFFALVCLPTFPKLWDLILVFTFMLNSSSSITKSYCRNSRIHSLLGMTSTSLRNSDCSVTLFDKKSSPGVRESIKLFIWNSESMESIWSTDYRSAIRFRSQISFFSFLLHTEKVFSTDDRGSWRSSLITTNAIFMSLMIHIVGPWAFQIRHYLFRQRYLTFAVRNTKN